MRFNIAKAINQPIIKDYRCMSALPQVPVGCVRESRWRREWGWEERETWRQSRRGCDFSWTELTGSRLGGRWAHISPGRWPPWATHETSEGSSPWHTGWDPRNFPPTASSDSSHPWRTDTAPDRTWLAPYLAPRWKLASNSFIDIPGNQDSPLTQ